MTRTVSETSLVSNIPPIQAESSQIVIHDEDENSNVLDIAEYCTNREVVNLENAAINVDNSTDVIFGPVTQLNVNGNVTIYSNGSPKQAINETDNQKERNGTNTENGGSTSKKLPSGCLHLLFVEKDVLRNLSVILVIILILLIITLILTNKVEMKLDDYNYNYTDPNYGDHLGSHKIFYRAEWGGKPPKHNNNSLKHPVGLVIISHTSTLSCNSTKKCFSLIKEVQLKHFDVPFDTFDIGYNFMIGGDANIYVGRGWDVQSFHRNANSIGISFIGDYNFDILTKDMEEAAKELINQGLELKKISKNYTLIGANQTSLNMYLSPGENVYRTIKNWAHFSNRTMF